MIPIDKSSNDPFYRYKMPEVVVSHETSKTVIQNLEQISKSLSRNPAHILKFLSMSFGCTSALGQKYALNGSFDSNRIQNGIYDFIDCFVLCTKCRNPETKFLFGKALKRSCNSCGAIFEQESHKLNILIAKDKGVNEDTKYEMNNKSNLYALLKEEQDNSKRICEVYKQESMTLDQLFSEYVKAKELKQLRLVLNEFKVDKILACVENMLESFKKEDKIDEYVHSLANVGFSVDDIHESISKPRVGKKRSPIVKKIFDGILSGI
ncbi:uncharacterized protein VICG_01403 [Vittaforma corneae ATCC 50505]|uniref:Translation initiation factor IF2/IF5 domain-containing protein n=1 Tax=Vittaforma corneae (strain ATCC 50505) TaxID=993615 RepID=L2GLM6_VITCO|nr:uncharacterized protein VICG_01403 [Vittaforma corneae ATCC 50505]ELA41539.1 hypothetical protein VICG_01403 [Vittaforma corneae ATCC 50505]